MTTAEEARKELELQKAAHEKLYRLSKQAVVRGSETFVINQVTEVEVERAKLEGLKILSRVNDKVIFVLNEKGKKALKTRNGFAEKLSAGIRFALEHLYEEVKLELDPEWGVKIIETVAQEWGYKIEFDKHNTVIIKF